MKDRPVLTIVVTEKMVDGFVFCVTCFVAAFAVYVLMRY